MSSGHKGHEPCPAHAWSTIGRRELLVAGGLSLMTGPARQAAAASPDQLTWGVHVSLAPTWFDPAETSGIITPFMVLYALHDAMVKPMPGNGAGAEPRRVVVTASEDGLSYDFVLREGAAFHNGDPVTAEDVKFSFERYRGAAHDLLKARVAEVETPDARHVRFRLKKPWPDFLTFYATATGAGWIVPKKYVEKVGEDGFKKAPVGAGPYKFVSFKPGVELVLEAFERLLAQDAGGQAPGLQGDPRRGDAAGRAEARRDRHRLFDPRRTGRGAAQHARPRAQAGRDPGAVLALLPRPVGRQVAVARRARAAGRQPRDRPQDHQPGADARLLGRDRQRIVPRGFDFYWQPPAPVYDPDKAKQLLAEAGCAAASMPATTIATPPTPISARPWSTTFSPSASAASCGRSSAPPSSRNTARRSTRTSSRRARAPSAMPRRASRPSS